VRIRELNEITERTGRSLVLVAAITDPAERLAAIDVLGPELEATVQAYADHAPLLEMRIRLRELSRESQRDLRGPRVSGWSIGSGGAVLP
jgi:hypothetical protein